MTDVKHWSRRRIVVVASSAVFVTTAVLGLILLDHLAESGHEGALGFMLVAVVSILGMCAVLIAIALISKLRDAHFKLPGRVKARLRGYRPDRSVERQEPRTRARADQEGFHGLFGKSRVDQYRKDDS